VTSSVGDGAWRPGPLSGGSARRWLLGVGRRGAVGLVAAWRGGRGWGLGAAAQDGGAAGRLGVGAGRSGGSRQGGPGSGAGRNAGCRPASGSNPSRRLARAEGGELSESRDVEQREALRLGMLPCWSLGLGWQAGGEGVWFFPKYGGGPRPTL
jgi:hypothetical protein